MLIGGQVIGLLLLICSVSPFNLEVRAPVIKVGVDDDSLFGYSVSQHHTVEGLPLLLVGAPLGTNLQPGTNRSGALYSCPLTSWTSDCKQVVTDGKRHNKGNYYGIYDGRIKTLNRPTSEEIKDGQWLGVAVSSQGPGGRVIVCAHRYTVRDVDRSSRRVIDSKRAMLGMCYILESDLTLPANTNIGSLNILVVREALRGKKMSTVSDFDNHARYGVCQLGTSMAWAPASNDSEVDNYALLGAPGCFTWRGNMFGQHTGSIGGYQSAVGEDNFLDLDKHGHLGLAVTSGRFFNNKIQYVSGAPHVNTGEDGNGDIYFYEMDLLSDRLKIDTERTLSGASFGAGFGFSLVKIDVNGDGQDDLLVGAPFSEKDGRGGAVFLYINIDQALQKNSFLEIRGQVWSDGQFGLSLASVGDINKDGFGDFAVGAPYEDQGVVYIFLGGPGGIKTAPGTKGVYQTFKAEELASQIIKASDVLGALTLNGGLATFGSSLSGGFDMDNNNYPDLLIGAHDSSTAILLRSRPVISVTTTLEDSLLHNVDPGQMGCELDPDSDHACFHFEACFSVESEEPEVNLVIRFSIIAEPKKAVSRVWLALADNKLKGGQSSRSSQVENLLTIQKGGVQHCTTILGYVSNSQLDLQTPVQFALSYSLIQEKPIVSYDKGMPLPQLSPILDQQQAKRTFYAKFQKNCGPDEICSAQLALHAKLFDKERELGRSPQGAYQLELGTLVGNELVLEVDIKNHGEAAYEATLDIAYSSALSYIGLGAGSEINAPNLVNSSHLSFNIGNPFKGVTEDNKPNSVKLRLRFSPSSVMNQTLLKFDFFANTSSVLTMDPSTYLHCVVVKRAEVTISGRGVPDTVFYGGEVKGESAITNVTEVGPLVNHRYLVKNNGPSMVDVLTVNIMWPYQVENNKEQGKWLFYLLSHPIVKNGAGSCHLPLGHFPNPLNLTITKRDNHSHRRRPAALEREPENLETLSVDRVETMETKREKREVEQIVAPMKLKGESGDKLVVRLDCARGTAKCLKITCQVYNVKANNSFTVEVKARLWNATLVEDYSNMDMVEVISRASVLVDPIYTQKVSNDFESIMTVALPDRKLEPLQQLSWWIYVIAVLCGIVVLMTIIYVLSKVGFFKRKRPDEETNYMVSANFEKVKLVPHET